MNKKGFTLVELLAVIAIIGILSVFVVPNILKVNSNVNERLYSQKVESIEYAAELYASSNPDIFNGTDVVYVTVQQLLESNYLEKDAKYTGDTTDNCSKTNVEALNTDKASAKRVSETGCVINDKDGSILNASEVKITKKNVGYDAEFITNKTSTASSTSATLVAKVCEGFSSNKFSGYTLENKECACKADSNQASGFDIVEKGNESIKVTECIIVKEDGGEPDNWLKYGGEEANWRVLGLYRVDGDQVSAKMITSDVVH